MSFFEPNDDPVRNEILQNIGELIELGFVEIVGITDDGEWLYGTTQAGKEALRVWGE
jgi:hypothetical protein